MRPNARSVPIEAPQDCHNEDRSRRPRDPNDEDHNDHDDGGSSASKSAIGAVRVSLLDVCRLHGCFHVALRLPTATKTTTTTATATNRHRCHRPLSSLAATAIDDDDDIRHDNIDQRNECWRTKDRREVVLGIREPNEGQTSSVCRRYANCRTNQTESMCPNRIDVRQSKWWADVHGARGSTGL